MIDEKALRAAYAELRARVSYLEAASGLFASDEDLDGRNGDPVVKFAPRQWTGDVFVGRPFSECSPEFLEMLAESLQYAADNPKPDKEKYAPYNRRDAARARSWARRIRSRPVVAPPVADDFLGLGP